MEAGGQNRELPRPYLVSILVNNRPGVLARVAALFSARGYNIEGLTAAHAEGPDRSRIACVTMGDVHTMERIVKQLRNLVEVIGVSHGPLEGSKLLGREMILVRVGARSLSREILKVVRKFNARVLAKDPGRIILEATGDSSRLECFLQELEPYKVQEVARSGPVVMRGHSRRPRNGSKAKGGIDRENSS
ncbi:MAG: acetolactate synthase small subunit [bacterium]